MRNNVAPWNQNRSSVGVKRRKGQDGIGGYLNPTQLILVG